MQFDSTSCPGPCSGVVITSFNQKSIEDVMIRRLVDKLADLMGVYWNSNVAAEFRGFITALAVATWDSRHL